MQWCAGAALRQIGFHAVSRLTHPTLLMACFASGACDSWQPVGGETMLRRQFTCWPVPLPPYSANSRVSRL